jgi:hypothetical protein
MKLPPTEGLTMTAKIHDITGRLNSAKLEALRRCARKLGLIIRVVREINEDVMPEFSGPYALIDADTGYYEAHIPGVNLAVLAEQIAQIEAEPKGD